MSIQCAALVTLLSVGAPPATAPGSDPLPAGATTRFHSDPACGLASGLHYSPNGKAIFCPTNDGTLAVFDPATGRLKHRLRGPSPIGPFVNGPDSGIPLYFAA